MNGNRFSVMLFIIFTLLFSGLFGALNQNPTQGKSAATPQIPSNSPATNYVLNLPLIGKSFPEPPPVYGVETSDFTKWKLDKANLANVFWVRNSAFSWLDIEPSKPSPNHTYNWNAVNNAGLIDAYNNNLTLIGVIKNTPSWARMPQYGAYG
jgi:hypothetical protein